MAEKRIDINIDGEGKISARTEGFQGETCLEELEELLDGLDEFYQITKTDEYYQSESRKLDNQQKNKRS